ncbi:HNH endonuclease [Arthrobacter phage Polka]|uniref:HNH endonuclease n=1 Tax=Arthrobacter phage Polka TaxID=2419966 RepID=A0A3G2KIM0_9CAUD|nr:HNH endonuclease [Arthrobacter phage Polka]
MSGGTCQTRGRGSTAYGAGCYLVGQYVETRNTAAQKRIIANLRAQRIRDCWLCGEPIDYEAGKDDGRSFSADHKKSWKKYPELREDPSNYAPAHLGCNQSRGNREPPAGLGLLSRVW